MAPTSLKSMSPEEKKKFMDSIDTIVTDCDGVIWNPQGVINNSHIAIEKLVKRGKKVYFVTNNSTKTRVQLMQKFQKFGFISATEDSVISTAGLAAEYFRNRLPPGKKVYLIGPPSVYEELRKADVPCTNPLEDKKYEGCTDIDTIFSAEIQLDENVGAVLIGFDIFINYFKIMKAASYLKNTECLFVVTNTDETFPSGRSFVVPGTGAIVAPIKVVSGREPYILGKPSTYLSEVLRNKFNPERTLFVGDRLNTDILTGNRSNFRTVLVLSGVHSLDDVKNYEKSGIAEERMSIPNYYANFFSDLASE